MVTAKNVTVVKIWATNITYKQNERQDPVHELAVALGDNDRWSKTALSFAWPVQQAFAT